MGDAAQREWIERAGFKVGTHPEGGYVAMKDRQGAWGASMPELLARVQQILGLER